MEDSGEPLCFRDGCYASGQLPTPVGLPLESVHDPEQG